MIVKWQLLRRPERPLSQPCVQACHLDVYGEDAAAAVAEIEEHRIFSISVALGPGAYAGTKKLAGDRPFVPPAFGIHPWMAPDHVDRLDRLAALVTETPMIGEIGLAQSISLELVSEPSQIPSASNLLEA